MRVIIILLLFNKVTSSLASEHSSTAQASQTNVAAAQIDTLHLQQMDTSSLEKFLCLNPALTFVSGISLFIPLSHDGTTLGDPLQEGKGPGKFPAILISYLGAAHKGDRILFTDIYVRKGDKKFRIPDRTFIVP